MKFNKDDKVIVVNTDNIWENKKGIVMSDVDKKEITNDTEDFLIKVFFDDNKTIIQPFNEDNLRLEDEDENLSECLVESKESNKKDFIYNYVYLEDLDDLTIPSWMFIDKLATAENISNEDVIEEAQKLGYKLYEVTQNHFKKIIVAAPKCKIETIEEECMDYVLGFITVTEIKENKGE